MLFALNHIIAQNPIICDQFTADPSARVFNGKVYVYPSHDILAKEGQGRPGWFCMEDYHVFSSENLTDWTDHGIIVSQNKVDWVDSTSYSMWAPDCIERNGKYYFYFPSRAKDESFGQAFTIGVAVADQPEGLYVPWHEPIKNVRGIDPNVFIDKDGQAYLYWSKENIYVAGLKENMLELASEPQVVAELPENGLKEGPYLFERKGIYYMVYPHVQNKIERLEYAIGDNPMGPFKFTGVIMDESPMNCWTNHQSVIEYNDQWYLFYHQNALSPKFDKNRAICIDSLFFNTDGTIQKIIPTLRGVGVTNATEKIQIDRYSKISKSGTTVEFNNILNTFEGWKIILSGKDAWVQYNTIDLGDKLKKIQIKVSSEKNSRVQIRLENSDGPLLGEVKIPKGFGWHIVEVQLSGYQPGIHNLVVALVNNNPVEIDWIRFLK